VDRVKLEGNPIQLKKSEAKRSCLLAFQSHAFSPPPSTDPFLRRDLPTEPSPAQSFDWHGDLAPSVRRVRRTPWRRALDGEHASAVAWLRLRRRLPGAPCLQDGHARRTRHQVRCRGNPPASLFSFRARYPKPVSLLPWCHA
jgi:hypothetical protein